MPYQDRTGPQGAGAMTGRGLGPCGGGMARGYGRNFCKRISFTKPQAGDLKNYVKSLENEVKDAKSYLKDLEDSKK